MVFLVARGDPQQSCGSGGLLGRELTSRAGTRSVNLRPRAPPELQLCCRSLSATTKTGGFGHFDLSEVTKSRDLGLTNSETCNTVAHMFRRNMMVIP